MLNFKDIYLDIIFMICLLICVITKNKLNIQHKINWYSYQSFLEDRFRIDHYQ
jgi:hypothetical protein